MMTEQDQAMIRRYGLEPHVEGGAFRETDTADFAFGEREAHGNIYYMLGQGERADFHSLTSDEYWLYHEGGSLELWCYDETGSLTIRRLGIAEGEEPAILLRRGVLFGAKHKAGDDRATLLSCVTVPKFTYEGYQLLRKDELLAIHPDAAGFFG